MPSKTANHDHYYKPYLMRFIGQLAARSPRECSPLRLQAGEDDGPVRRVTHSLYPRSLVVYDATTGTWTIVDDEAVVKRKTYVAVTYCCDDMTPSGSGTEVLIQRVRDATLHQGYDAYWLDLECLLEDPSQNAQDLYRMSDVYRRASFTLIVLSDETVWAVWGSRVWTLAETLLGRELRYKAGNNAVIPISLFEIASLAYSHYDEESKIITSFGVGKDQLKRLNQNLCLKEAIWRRVSSSPQFSKAGGCFQARYRAEKVYALMGFFEHRILPNAEETELQALARLFMANDRNRLLDRMISMFPRDPRAMNQWYTKEDEYGAKLLDIDPDAQVIGITHNGALVLDGCRAAAIRWKDFPYVAFATKRSVSRALAVLVPYLAVAVYVVGVVILGVGQFEKINWGVEDEPLITGGTVVLAISLLMLLLSPLLTAYGHSAPNILARPWLVGVRGVISPQQASEYLGDFRRTLYTPSGSPFKLARQREHDSRFREGHDSQYEAALAAPPFDPIEGHMFTLVDNISGTIYYFRAHRPPTVCIFTGTQGGLGRYVLCSGECSNSELRRETVLRMPTCISAYMHTCDWVALGGET
ncbi:hypothetical protein AZE42_01326 [Rhizopogon vesiculosus]|uniref:Heterokaryon incompatibility domain-containing protein n=1 Tax=Rhizopogon vesiculosus TaxID=180088 RepID=A0A1J8PYM2_9AGAM|nr:hypothetical protein AZE42_01326 [Rhizopogon vesiculosus]